MKGQPKYELKFNAAWVAKVSKEDFIRAQAHLANWYKVDLAAEYDKAKALIDGNTPSNAAKIAEGEHIGRGGGNTDSKKPRNRRSAEKPVVSGEGFQGSDDTAGLRAIDNSQEEEKGAAD